MLSVNPSESDRQPKVGSTDKDIRANEALPKISADVCAGRLAASVAARRLLDLMN